MACGLPIAAVDVGDVKAMVSEENRGLIAAVDNARLSQALLYWLRHPDHASSAGNANRAKVVEHYDIKRMCAAHASLLQHMIEFSHPSA
jgi:glycosyltransferase involved in cell wall biosynthesis